MTSTLTKYKEYAYEIIYLTGDFKKKLPLFVLMFIILSLLDLAGIGLILPYVALISSPESFFNNDIVAYFANRVDLTLQKKDHLIIGIGIILVILFIVKTIFAIFIKI